MIGQRIELIRGKQPRDSFSAELGVHPQTLARYEKGERLPDSAFLEILAKRFGVDPAWLLTGAGKPFNAFETIPESSPPGDGRQHGELTSVPVVEARLAPDTGLFVAVAADQQRFAFSSRWISAKGQPARMVLMRVDGDSMEPQILGNDMALIDLSQTAPRAGGLFAVAVEDLVYLKVVDAVPGKLILKSCNPAYAPLLIEPRTQPAGVIRIVGRAVWIGRELA